MGVNIRPLLFACDGNSSVGFGHFTRCLAIARAIGEVAPSTRIMFWGDYSEFARSTLHGTGIELCQSPETIDRQEVCLIHDHYDVDQASIDELVKTWGRFIKIDDFASYNLADVDMVVNFRFGAEAFPYNARKICLGLDYFPAKLEFTKIRRERLALQEARGNSGIAHILLFIGGAGNDDAYSMVLSVLDRVTQDVVVTLIDPKAEKTPAGDFRTDYTMQRNKLHVSGPVNDITPFYTDADCVICGGGVTKYEAGFCLLPNACLSQTQAQWEDTKILAEANITFDLGFMPEMKDRSELLMRQMKAFLTEVEAGIQKRNLVQAYRTNSVQHLAAEILDVARTQ